MSHSNGDTNIKQHAFLSFVFKSMLILILIVKIAENNAINKLLLPPEMKILKWFIFSIKIKCYLQMKYRAQYKSAHFRNNVVFFFSNSENYTKKVNEVLRAKFKLEFFRILMITSHRNFHSNLPFKCISFFVWLHFDFTRSVVEA